MRQVTKEELNTKKKSKTDYFDMLKKEAKLKILKRDKYTCKYCGASLKGKDTPTRPNNYEFNEWKNNRKDPTIDHVIPISKGGSDNKENLVACCLKCNRLKGNKMLK